MICIFFFSPTVSLDYKSSVQVDMPGVLLHSDGDMVTLSWTPTNVLPPEIAGKDDYRVAVEVFAYISNVWTLFEEFANTVANTGVTLVPNLSFGPNGTDPIVPIAFSLKAVDSVNLTDFIRPIVQAGQVGIWSPVVYKITDPGYIVADMCAQFVASQPTTGPKLLKKAISCPCRLSQARHGNSMFQEQISGTAVMMRKFFYPKADACFLSTITG
jgi:hypothetical protein